MKNKALILLIALAFIFMTGAVSAVNQTDVVIAENYTDDALLQNVAQKNPVCEVEDEILGENATKTTIKSDDKNIVKGQEFSVRLADENSTPIANKTVDFTLNKVKTSSKTDGNGVAKLKINVNPGTYTVKYSFGDEGYLKSENSTRIFVIPTSSSKISASNYVAYVGVKNTYTVTLNAGNTPLPGRAVTFKINGKTYSKTTNSKGQASININEKKGTYSLSYSYAGEDNIKKTSGSAKITVKKGIPTKISKANSVVYVNKKTNYFKIKLTDVRGNLLKSKKVFFKLKGKTYAKKTSSKGIATLKIKLNTGTYKIKVTYPKNSKYNKALKTFKINVKPRHPTNNGMWLFGRDMYSVDFNKLQKNGFKHILLNFKAVELYGKAGVEKWVKEARSHGIKVHLWMQVFYKAGGWQNPVSNGKINYNLINSKVKEAKTYAKIKGISGIHFDYVRYPGNAHNYKNSVNAINTFIKKATTAVHKINKNIIVSAAVMPEPSSMIHYYGQDIRTMGKYLDAIIPMVYKGNYNAGQSWIKWVTQTFKKQSSKAQIWTGLQSYRSDANLGKIPAKELMGDCKAASYGGASGIILFRFGLFNDINFNEV